MVARFNQGSRLRRLALPYKVGKVLGEVDGLGHLGMLLPELGELLRFGLGALRLASQHQPGRPAWCQGLARGLGHGRQGLACAAMPGRQALGLPQTTGIGRDHPIAARIATLAKVAKQPHGGIARPHSSARGDTAYRELSTLSPRSLRRLRPAKVAVRRSRWTVRRLSPTCCAMAGAVQPWRCKAQTCVCSACRWAWRCTARCCAGRGMVMGWHRHGHRPIRQWYRLLVHQGIDRVECLAVRAEHLVQGFPEILQQMKAVCDLGGCRCPVPCALGIGGRAIARDDLDPWMLPEPLG